MEGPFHPGGIGGSALLLPQLPSIPSHSEDARQSAELGAFLPEHPVLGAVTLSLGHAGVAEIHHGRVLGMLSFPMAARGAVKWEQSGIWSTTFEGPEQDSRCEGGDSAALQTRGASVGMVPGSGYGSHLECGLGIAPLAWE